MYVLLQLRAQDWLGVLTGCGKGLRGREWKMENWHLIEIEQDDMIMSGEVNKWGVKAALDCESFQNSPAVDSYGFVCSMSHNDWGRMVT